MKHYTIILGLLIAWSFGTALAHASESESVYLFSYYTGRNHDKDGLHLAWSQDGFRWEAVGGGASLLKSDFGSWGGEKRLRDPFIMQDADGYWHCLWTLGMETPRIAHARSKDLIRWERHHYVPVMGGYSTKNCWAPKMLFDPENKLFFIYWSSNVDDKGNRLYYTTTTDFVRYAPAKLLYDPGHDVVDANIMMVDGKFWIIYWHDKSIKAVRADTLTGEYKTFGGGKIHMDRPLLATTLNEDKTLSFYVRGEKPGQVRVYRTPEPHTVYPWTSVEITNDCAFPENIQAMNVARSSMKTVEYLQQEIDARHKKHHDNVSFDKALAPEDVKEPVIATLVVDGSKRKKISDELIGVFFEDINYSADGGLYAELVQNRGFEYSPKDRGEWNAKTSWELSTPEGDATTFEIETENPLHKNNPHYAVLATDGKAASLINEGFDGIPVKNGDLYDFSVFARSLSEDGMTFRARLIDKDGKTLGESTAIQVSKDWKKYEAAIKADADFRDGRLAVVVESKGKIALDMVSLFPQKTFKNRKNGLRADLAQAIADLNPKFVRFPGGCLVHGVGLGNIYHWKNTVGPLEQRVPQRNLWGYHQSAGLGYYEYFQFCEDLGAEALPVVAAGMCCQNTPRTGAVGIPMDEMPAYIQDILDLIEFANGDASTEWGKKRAKMGRPDPFNLKYIGVGNEDIINDDFEERFTMIFNAVKEKHPEIVLIGTVGPFHEGTDYDEGWKLAKNLKVPIVDEHYYLNPGWFINNQAFYDDYERNSTKVYLGEYATKNNMLYNALAEAAFLCGIERNGDVVHMASYAPLLAKERRTQWGTDLIFFNNTDVKPTPSYFVQKFFGNNAGQEYVDSRLALSLKDEMHSKRVAASVVRDEESGDLIVKLVNILPVQVETKISFENIDSFGDVAEVQVLSGNPGDRRVNPVVSNMKVGKEFSVNMAPHSMTVIRIAKEMKPIYASNPIIWADVPDISILRVGDDYYMSSTTMHMNPGVPIMKSKNLVDWDIVSYTYDILADTDGLALRNGKSEYGFGTWASSIRYHNDMFVLSTFARSTGKTHIYTTKSIENEPWKETTFSPMLHDHTLFFDDDGKAYMLYGESNLRLIELESDLSGVKEGGFNEVVIPNAWKICANRKCLFEGSQMFKHEGKYYLSNIAWPAGKVRTQTIYRADKITGPYEGRVILQDRGIAQGSLIDTPDGRWYAYLFQDSGAVGRIPYIVPVRWEDGWPILGVDSKVPMTLDIIKERPGLGNIVSNDEFDRDDSLLAKLKAKQKNENDYLRDAFPPAWQWNHNPDNRFWSLSARPGWLRLTSGRTDKSLPEARNMLTQRTFGPKSEAWTVVDTTGMKDGDLAGLTTFQKVYGIVCVKMDGEKKSVIVVRTDKNGVAIEDEVVSIDAKNIHLKISCNFENLRDEATFFWSLDGKDWKKIGGVLKMEYTIPHFMGYRFGLFHFSTKTAGGYADFDYYHISEPAYK